MKKFLLAAVAALAPSGSAYAQDAFERGFDQGYQAGNPGHFTPLPPLPTLPKLGQSDFQAGIAAGMNRAHQDRGDDTPDDDDQ